MTLFVFLMAALALGRGISGGPKSGHPVSWDWGHGDTESVQREPDGTIRERTFGGHEIAVTTNAQELRSEAKSAPGSAGGEGHLEVTSEYDSAGRLILQTDATRGLTDSYEYGDVLRRLVPRPVHEAPS